MTQSVTSCTSIVDVYCNCYSLYCIAIARCSTKLYAGYISRNTGAVRCNRRAPGPSAIPAAGTAADHEADEMYAQLDERHHEADRQLEGEESNVDGHAQSLHGMG